MPEENINQELRLEKKDEIRNYLVEEINQNEFMSKKLKKRCRVFHYIDHLLIAISTIAGYVSISPFAFLVGIPIGITSSAIGSKICAITTGIKKFKAIIKKNKKKHKKTVSLAKSKLSRIKVLISKDLIDSNIGHDILF